MHFSGMWGCSVLWDEASLLMCGSPGLHITTFSRFIFKICPVSHFLSWTSQCRLRHITDTKKKKKHHNTIKNQRAYHLRNTDNRSIQKCTENKNDFWEISGHAEWVRTLTKPWWPEFDSCNPHDAEKRESIPASCPLTFTHTSAVRACTDTQKQI